MKIYRDLVFCANRKELDDFIGRIESSLSHGWARSHAREKETHRAVLGPMYCFSCTAAESRPACELWIATRSDGCLYVTNVLVQEQASLTHDQYNEIVREFCDRFARPASQGRIKVELGDSDQRIEDFLTPSTTELLSNFSKLANRAILHPSDRKRWNEFLTAVYRDRAALRPDTLQRWLVEEEKWPEDEAINLAIEYEHARDLLGIYEPQPT